MAKQDCSGPALQTVLVVDDDSDCRSILRAVAETDGVQVLEACDGEKAVRLVERVNPVLDAVILDFNMPVMDGISTLVALRELRPGLKAIMCSANSEARCLGGAVVDGLVFLEKPFNLARLRAALDAALA